ncbi:hypothetical protein GCM10010840_36130 [Deinococcus aerolatus]|uniref:DUF4403 family protein n=1 Tax=Deinococcus aerolatus TaxID=522487 RepID=A0ABQ2GGZ4_9DEIO|nr:DUF4403 family protein [Deinococcus aerolatus]GGL94860.1 hypothetical protein GCM10010840_36130 [Deinococcus aerolatus]
MTVPLPLPASMPAPAPAASVTLPLRLPYPELSQLATAWAAGQVFTLPLPTAPSLRVTDIRISAGGTRLKASLSVQSSGLLGLKATLDVSGRPVLDVAGQVLTLEDTAVSTRKEGLGGRLIGMLADARVTASLARLARVDFAARLAGWRGQAQALLPFVVRDGIEVTGTVTQLAVTTLKVTPDDLTLTAVVGGDLQVTLTAAGLLPREGLSPGSLR